MSLILTPAGLPIQTVTTAAAGAGNAATFVFDGAPHVTLLVAGTFSLTLTFEASVDGLTWAGVDALKLSDGTLVATTTATGLFAFTNTGLAAVRARCSAFTSGAATISAGRGLGALPSDGVSPPSVTDGHMAVFNGTTGLLKDGGAPLTVPGSDTQILFNDSGALGANAGLTFDHRAATLNLLGTLSAYRQATTGGAQAVGIQAEAANTGTATGEVIGVSVDYVDHAGSGTVARVVGVDIRGLDATGGGPVTGMFGLYAGTNASSSGHVTTAAGVYIADQSDAADTNYALFVADQGVGATNWAIKTGIGKLEFGDDAIVHGSVTATDYVVSGSGFKTDTVDGHQAKFQAYDVDGTAYVDFITLTNGNTPTCVVQATDFKAASGDSGVSKVLNLGVLGTLTIQQGIITASTIAEV